MSEKNEEVEEVAADILEFIMGENVTRQVCLYGPVDEESSREIIENLLASHKSNKKKISENIEPTSIEFIISTHGGDASEMFAIYDTVQFIKKTSPVQTVGLGKVMSAGVLLLASGTKGKRKIGSHCRLMLHDVKGSINSSEQIEFLKGEIEEIEWFKESYVKCLAKETNLSKKQIKKIMSTGLNSYLSAKEAIEMGIADEII